MESGDPEMLTETEVLASGSLKGFLIGKYFNICKRVYSILALALEIFHFLAFFDTYHQEKGLKNESFQLSKREKKWSQPFHLMFLLRLLLHVKNTQMLQEQIMVLQPNLGGCI